VVDRDGLKVLDTTHLDRPQLVPGASVTIADARNISVSRTYAYVAAGKQGIAIVDVERPEHPVLEQVFNADGKLQDTNDVKVGMVSSSQFALVADGSAGFKVLQLFSPGTSPGFYGFSPKPAPKLIAAFHTRGPALAVSRGVDRDRAVDESGNQLSVFGRRGSRPFNLEEMQRLYLRNDELYTVSDDPPGPASGRSERHQASR
jgi:LVIVD repeat